MPRRGLKQGQPKRVADRPMAVEQITADLAHLPLLLKDTDIAKILRIPTATLRKARCSGAIRGASDFPPHVRIGGRIFYKKASLISWLDSLEERNAL